MAILFLFYGQLPPDPAVLFVFLCFFINDEDGFLHPSVIRRPQD